MQAGKLPRRKLKKKLKNSCMAISKKAFRNVLVIGGPTCSGEDTVAREIIKKIPLFKKLVTATSRKPRKRERDKIAYYFFSNDSFKKEIKKGSILEYTYIKNRNVYYGAYKPDLENKLDAGFNVIALVDIIGAKYYKNNYNAVTIFLKPESLNIIKKRLLKREPNISKEELVKRLKNAKDEIANEENYYDYSIINRDGYLKNTVKDVIKILKKEKYILK
jgi:guanylate kinase